MHMGRDRVICAYEHDVVIVDPGPESSLAALDGVEPLHDAPVVREFAVRLDAPVDQVLDLCAADGIAAGYPLGREYPEHEDGLLVAITERRTREDIDRLADSLSRAVAKARGKGAEVAR